MLQETDRTTEFERHAADKPPSFLGEFYYFLSTNKKWWMLPMLLALGLLSGLVIATSTGALPFVYALF